MQGQEAPFLPARAIRHSKGEGPKRKGDTLMGGLNIITADARMAERRGSKICIVGPSGVGKTSLLRTTDANSTLFVDLESGDLAVQDVPVDQLRPQTWPELRDLACFLAGPAENLSAKATYGAEHYERAVEQFGSPDTLSKYQTVFLDSLTVASRMCFAWAEHQPEAFTKQGAKDLLGVYGTLGREMMAFIGRLQHARMNNIVFVCLLEEKEDDFKRKSWQLQLEGSKTPRELPGVVDELITMAIIRPDDGEPFRAFITAPDNEWGFPAKDRSGRLDAMEPPDLGRLFAKLNDTARGHSAKNFPRAAA
jgi:hypothetical protein